MNRIVIRHPAAIADLQDISDYIALDSLEAGIRFLLAAEQTFQRLGEMPGVGFIVGVADLLEVELRCWRVTGFPNYLVFYRFSEDTVEIIRVLHGARDIERAFSETPL